MYKHIIPVNISADGNLFGGIIKKRNALEASLVLLAGILLFKIFLFALPMMIKTALFILFVIFPAVITLIGINNQSVIELIILVISYKRKPEIYPYNIQTDASVEPEPTSFLEKRAAKKEAKKKQKEAKKTAKAQMKADKAQYKMDKKAGKQAYKQAGKEKKRQKKK